MEPLIANARERLVDLAAEDINDNWRRARGNWQRDLREGSADAFDRMTRASENPISRDEALAALGRDAGLRYDPDLVATFAAAVERGSAETTDAPSAVWRQPIVRVDDRG